MLFSGDQTDDEFVCIAQVPKEVVAAKGLKANEWVDSAKALFGNAKGGGREESAQMNGSGVSKVCAILFFVVLLTHTWIACRGC
jgi:alanyl-tRNA synthetase